MNNDNNNNGFFDLILWLEHQPTNQPNVQTTDWKEAKKEWMNEGREKKEEDARDIGGGGTLVAAHSLIHTQFGHVMRKTTIIHSWLIEMNTK